MRIAVASGGGKAQRAAIDPHGTLPGRGAYLCRAGAAAPPAPKPECVRLAERNRGIARTLRRAVTLDVECLESGYEGGAAGRSPASRAPRLQS